MRVLSVVAAVHIGLANPALASNLDSEHLFGLTEGSDIGTPGERELELELAARAGKRGGVYRVLSQANALKLTLTDSFRVSPIVGIDHHRIRGVPGLDDRNQWALGELAFEMKYRVLDRQAAPFGLTFGATPTFARVDEVGGEWVDGYGMKISAMADRELIAGKLLAAVNLGYSPEASRPHATGVWEHESSFAASAAISGRVTERVFLSGELRYERAYDGLALDHFAGHALFAGPAIYARLTDNAWISALWNAQIAGRATGMSGTLDLTNFERHLVKMRLGIQF
jgi:hypothetical protein